MLHFETILQFQAHCCHNPRWQHAWLQTPQDQTSGVGHKAYIYLILKMCIETLCVCNIVSVMAMRVGRGVAEMNGTDKLNK